PRPELEARLLLGLRRQGPYAHRRVWLWMALAWLVEPAVEVERLRPAPAVGEEPGEGVGQAEMRGHLRAVVGAAQHPHLRRRLREGIGLHGPERMALGQRCARGPRDHVAHVGGELGRAL